MHSDDVDMVCESPRAKYIAQVIVHAHNLSTSICEHTFGYMSSVLPLSE